MKIGDAVIFKGKPFSSPWPLGKRNNKKQLEESYFATFQSWLQLFVFPHRLEKAKQLPLA